MSINYNEQKKLSIKRKAKKRKKRRALSITILVIVVLAVVIAGSYLLINYRKYSGYSVKATIALSGASDNLSYYTYGSGYIQCSNSGVVYFDESDIIWDETFDMASPLIDICGDYVAVSDLKQSDVYIYDKNGLVSRISSTHDILDVEISKNGIVAIAANDGETNFIELKDSEGTDLINVKSVFSSSGYLNDITLSEDGTKVAASFIYVSQGSLESKVLFYDFSKDDTDNMLVGGFSQYDDTVLTTVEYMDGDVVCAIGDNALTFYKFSGTPSIITEQLDLDWEIQSVSTTDRYILLVIKDDSNEHNYRAEVFNTSGDQIADVGFDFAYSKAVIAGKNILLYSSTDCQIYSFKGYQRFSGAFDDRITYILPDGSAANLLLSTVGNLRLIKLK